VQVTQWYEVADAATNPLLTDRVGVTWPTDPLGARRASVEHAAALVRHAMAGPQQESLPLALTPRATQWSRDVDVLLAERAAAVSGATVSVDLPAHLSVSDVVMIAGDSAGLARRLRRPMPARPARAARRGTAFHEWLEGRWHADTLLDIDDLPGAVDDTIDDADLESLKAKFERSDWADRTPIAVEVPFEMVFGGRVVRGRMDAVFAEPDGRFTVVDWKTGAPPSGADADQKAIQLAVYRLAWAQLNHLDDAELHRVAAAFYYVGSGLTVAPANLLTLQELRELINGSSGHPVINGSSGRRPVAPVPSASS
jgi:DNA helicase-2/ATP-dependent DNA helicase PcrA